MGKGTGLWDGVLGLAEAGEGQAGRVEVEPLLSSVPVFESTSQPHTVPQFTHLHSEKT